MDRTATKAKLSRECGREAEIVATHKHEAIVGVPMVVRMPVVVVEPQLVPIVFDVEHVEIAVAVSFVWSAVCTTTL